MILLRAVYLSVRIVSTVVRLAGVVGGLLFLAVVVGLVVLATSSGLLR